MIYPRDFSYTFKHTTHHLFAPKILSFNDKFHHPNHHFGGIRSRHKKRTLFQSRKIKSNRGKRKILTKKMIEYCTRSSVHGVNYLIDDRLNWIER